MYVNKHANNNYANDSYANEGQGKNNGRISIADQDICKLGEGGFQTLDQSACSLSYMEWFALFEHKAPCAAQVVPVEATVPEVARPVFKVCWLLRISNYTRQTVLENIEVLSKA